LIYKDIILKIIVPIKRVIDAYVNIRVKSDCSGIETQNVKMSMNPFCEIAVEEAVRMRERGEVEEIILVSIGPQTCQETLRAGLALGADRAILIESEENLQPLSIAKILRHIVEQEQPQMVMLGKQAIDDDNNQTGQMLAGLLGWPQATFASKIKNLTDKVEVTREIDGGLETLQLTLPCVITTDLRLNEPRYTALPNIMQAKRKPLEVTPLADLNLSLKTHLTTQQVTPPEQRQAGVKVGSVSELMDKLINEVKVIA
jgi:electron transfer flavoprotein beta subunit